MLRVVSLVLVVLGLWLIVVPQWQEAVGVLPRLERIPIAMVVLAAVAQVSSLLCFSAMTTLIVGTGLSYGTALRIDLADLAINHTVPGGGGVAAAARFRMLVWRGIAPTRAFAAASVEVSLSNIALSLVFIAGLLLAFGAAPVTAAQVGAVVAVSVLLVAAAAAIWVVLRRPAWPAAVVGRLEGRAPALRRLQLSSMVDSAQRQLMVLKGRPGRLALCAAFAIGNWVLDAASLWLLLAALGAPIPPGPLLAAYGVATVLTQLPITPGGIGIVEGILVPALIAFGVPAATALLAVLGWRTMEFWLPIPAGGLTGLSLGIGRSKRTHHRTFVPRGRAAEAETVDRAHVRPRTRMEAGDDGRQCPDRGGSGRIGSVDRGAAESRRHR